MTDDITKSLKERSKLEKSYYKNGQRKIDYNKLLEKSADCTKKITQAKNDYINKMTDIFQNPSIAPKTFRAILSRLLYDKSIPAIPPLLIDGKFVSDFCQKGNFSNYFFSSICTPIQNTSISLLFYIGQMPE